MAVLVAHIQVGSVEDHPGRVGAGADHGVMDGVPKVSVQRDGLTPDLRDVWVFIHRDGIAPVLDHLTADREPDGDLIPYNRGDVKGVLTTAALGDVVQVFVSDKESDRFTLGPGVELDDGGGVEVGGSQLNPAGVCAFNPDAAQYGQRRASGDNLAQTRKGGPEFRNGKGDGIHNILSVCG